MIKKIMVLLITISAVAYSNYWMTNNDKRHVKKYNGYTTTFGLLSDGNISLEVSKNEKWAYTKFFELKTDNDMLIILYLCSREYNKRFENLPLFTYMIDTQDNRDNHTYYVAFGNKKLYKKSDYFNFEKGIFKNNKIVFECDYYKKRIVVDLSEYSKLIDELYDFQAIAMEIANAFNDSGLDDLLDGLNKSHEEWKKIK